MLNSKIGAKLYSVQLATGPNGERYVKTFIGQDADPADTSTKGVSLMSLSTEPSVFDSLNIRQFPCDVEIEVQLQRGGQNKLKQHVVAISPLRQPAAAKA